MDSNEIRIDKGWALIVNPVSGSGKCLRFLPDFRRKLDAAGIEYHEILSEYAGHIPMIVRDLAKEGFCRFMIAGGDGSLHEALNGAMRASEEAGRFMFLSIPFGTANDWSRYYGITQSDDVIKAIQENKSIDQDLGRVDWLDEPGQCSWFINVLGVGFDAFVADVLAKNGKGVFGKASYLWTVLKCLRNYKATHLHLETEKSSTELFCFTVNVGITSFSGNGMQIVPHARGDDGLLALTRIEPMRIYEVLLNIYKLYSGAIGRHPKVRLSQEKYVQLLSLTNDKLSIEADGEVLRGGNCIISCLPRQIRTLYLTLKQPKL